MKFYVKLLSILLSLLIFVSSTGLRLRIHVCTSSQTVLKSFITSELSCDHDEISSELLCLEGQSSEDCCPAEQAQQTPHQDCCSDFSQYYKISLDTDLNSQKQNDIQLIVVDIHQPFQEDKVTLIDNKPFEKKVENNTVPLAGIRLLTKLHQLKIDLDCMQIS